ncbi:MAG: hypothetical protein ACKVP0_05290 [Pirellulaceae bacterium]
MSRTLVLAFAFGLSVLAIADTTDAGHHRRARRRGCGGCGDGCYTPAHYDGKGGYQNYDPSMAPTPPSPPAPPAPPPAPRAT